MAITFTAHSANRAAEFNRSAGTFYADGYFAFANPYTVGGEDQAAATINSEATSIVGEPGPFYTQDGSHYCKYNATTAKWKMYVAATGVEAGAVDLSADPDKRVDVSIPLRR
jgi:hypothetical protein